jgi:hypothetical protein
MEKEGEKYKLNLFFGCDKKNSSSQFSSLETIQKGKWSGMEDDVREEEEGI